MKPAGWSGLGIAALAALVPAAVAGADSFNPVSMKLTVAGVARLHQPLRITVHVAADPETLSTDRGTVRAQVKLTSGDCGGTFATTPGVVLLDKPLKPQPGTGAYSGAASGSGKPTAYGTQIVCAFIDNDYQKLADDTTNPPQVNVSKPCTLAAARYDRARRSRRRGRLRRAARHACGPGVPL